MNDWKAEFRIRDDIRSWALMIMFVQLALMLIQLMPSKQSSHHEKLCQTEKTSAP